MEFKDNLKHYRIQRGFSRQYVSEQLNLSLSVLSAYETGARKPSYEVLEGLSDILDVSVDELMGRVKYKTPAIDEKILDMMNSFYNNKELLRIVEETPNNDTCKKCVIVNYLAQLIVKLTD